MKRSLPLADRRNCVKGFQYKPMKLYNNTQLEE
jgi:hypothetical protein